MGYQIVGITVIIAWVSLISFPAFLIMRKVHVLRVDKAIEEIGLDIGELGNVSEDFIDAVREKIEAQEKIANKVKIAELEEEARKILDNKNSNRSENYLEKPQDAKKSSRYAEENEQDA